MGVSFVRFLAVAVIGTLAIYFGAPRLKPLLQTGAQVQAQGAADQAAPRAAPTPHALLAAAPRTSAPAGLSAGINVPDSTAPSLAADDAPAVKGTEEPASGSDDNATPAPAAAEEQEVVVVNTPDFTPSTQEMPTSGPDVTHWGVTLANTPFFDRDGARRDNEVPGGTLVEITGVTSSSKGEMAICRVAGPQKKWAGPYLLAMVGLMRFEGTRERIDAGQVRDLCRYFALNGKIEARKLELQRAAVDANPHGAELRKAQAEYQSAAEKSEELKNRFEQAQGADRTRVGEELRKLQNDVIRLQERLAYLNRQYKEWKAAHGTPAAADPARDPVIKTLEAEMARILPRLEGLGV
ncbi:MAG: hypothetical protein PHR35_11830 [Kiritimatiellae bacterium]|nr:hypothetical protein [Kiritimatiellia bacterium]